MNTTPTFAWYIAGLVFQWLKRQGGLERVGEINRAKAEKLYAAIDGRAFYRNPVARDARSWMNVPFTLARPELDKTFIADARQAGLVTLEGHRSVGGMREPLQRHADGRSGCAGGVYGRVRAQAWVERAGPGAWGLGRSAWIPHRLMADALVSIAP